MDRWESPVAHWTASLQRWVLVCQPVDVIPEMVSSGVTVNLLVWAQVSHLLSSALPFLFSYLSPWFVLALGFLFCFFSGCFLWFGLLLVDDIWFGFYCSVLVHARQVLDHWQQPQPPLHVSVTLLVCKWWAIYLVPKVKSTFSHQFHIHLKTPSLPLSLGCNLCQSLSREVESMWQWWREVKASFSNWAGICGLWLFHSVIGTTLWC